MKTVLVVDDEVEIVDFLGNFLRRAGINSLKATSGITAIDIFKENKPDWVFLDITMPDMDGFTVLKELKKVEPEAKVMMITGREAKESQAKAKSLGVIDYIVKPLDLKELHSKVEQYILSQK